MGKWKVNHIPTHIQVSFLLGQSGGPPRQRTQKVQMSQMEKCSKFKRGRGKSPREMLHANLMTSSTFLLADEDIEDILRNAGKDMDRQNLQHRRVSHPLATPCTECRREAPRRKRRETPRAFIKHVSGERKVNHFRIRTRMSSQKRRNHSLDHYGLVRTPLPIPKMMKIPAARAAVDIE